MITPAQDPDKKRWETTSHAILGLVVLGVIACVAVAIWYITTKNDAKYIIAWSVAAFFVSVAVPVALHAIHMNILYYRHPLQRHYIRILWIIPIYSVESWIALRYSAQRVYLETMREAYEAYVVYSFFCLLRDYLGKDFTERSNRLEKMGRDADPPREHVHHIRAILFCFADCMPKWRLGAQFLSVCSFNVFQFVFIRVLFALAILVLENVRTPEPCYYSSNRRLLPRASSLPAHAALRANVSAAAAAAANATANEELVCPNYYGEGTYAFNRLYLYEVFCVNVSQMWAMYNLVHTI